MVPKGLLEIRQFSAFYITGNKEDNKLTQSLKDQLLFSQHEPDTFLFRFLFHSIYLFIFIQKLINWLISYILEICGKGWYSTEPVQLVFHANWGGVHAIFSVTVIIMHSTILG